MNLNDQIVQLGRIKDDFLSLTYIINDLSISSTSNELWRNLITSINNLLTCDYISIYFKSNQSSSFKKVYYDGLHKSSTILNLPHEIKNIISKKTSDFKTPPNLYFYSGDTGFYDLCLEIKFSGQTDPNDIKQVENILYFSNSIIKSVLYKEELISFQDILGKTVNRLVTLNYIINELNQISEINDLNNFLLNFLKDEFEFSFAKIVFIKKNCYSVFNDNIADNELSETLKNEYSNISDFTITDKKLIYPVKHKEKAICIIYCGILKELLREESDMLKVLFLNFSAILLNKLLAYQILQSHRRLFELSIKDPLTNLYNRRYMHKNLEKKISCCFNTILLFVDFDFFKKINDTYGHLAGDYILKESSSIFQSFFVKFQPFISRYGGEEIVFIFSDVPDLNLLLIEFENLRKYVENFNFDFEGIKIKLTISGGVGLFTKELSLPADALIKTADDNLYAAKTSGRNCIYYNFTDIKQQ